MPRTVVATTMTAAQLIDAARTHNRAYVLATVSGDLRERESAAGYAAGHANQVLCGTCTPDERRQAITEAIVAGTWWTPVVHSLGVMTFGRLVNDFSATEPQSVDVRQALETLAAHLAPVTDVSTPHATDCRSRLQRYVEAFETLLFEANMRENGFTTGLTTTQLRVLGAMEIGRERHINGTVATITQATGLATGVVTATAKTLRAGGLVRWWNRRYVTKGEGFFALTDLGKEAHTRHGLAGRSLGK